VINVILFICYNTDIVLYAYFKKLILIKIKLLTINQPTKMSSICIPRVDATMTKDFIYKTITNLRVGNIEKVTEIPLRSDSSYKRIIIKLNWNNNPKSINMQKLLANTGSIKLVYDMPWYWKIVPTHPQI